MFSRIILQNVAIITAQTLSAFALFRYNEELKTYSVFAKHLTCIILYEKLMHLLTY